MLENVIKKLLPIRDEKGRPCTFPTFASQVFFDDGTVLEGKQFGGGGSVDPLTLYPVGSIYMSVNSTSPASLFGGTWEQLKGRILFGTGHPGLNDDGTSPGDYEFIPNYRGGEFYHTLTIDEMPSHSHRVRLRGFNTGTNDEAFSNESYSYEAGGTFGEAWKMISDAGGNLPHNNMPPYLTVYMWKRVA